MLLVHDCGPDGSARVIRELEAKHSVRPAVWLSRNFGQHAATLAGMASSGGDWIVTIDEDGQHDPAFIGGMLDKAMRGRPARLRPADQPPPHSALRNAASRGAKRSSDQLSGGSDASVFHSFRLIVGEVGRSVAAYAGPGSTSTSRSAGWPARRSRRRSSCATRESGGRGTPPQDADVALLADGAHRRHPRRCAIVSVLGVVFALLGVVLAVFMVVAGRPGPHRCRAGPR